MVKRKKKSGHKPRVFFFIFEWIFVRLYVYVCVWGDGLIESSMWVVCLSCFMYANQKLFLSKIFQPTTIHPLPDISVYTVVGYPHNNNNTCTPWIYQETIITAMDSIYTHTHANYIQTQNQHLRSRYYPSNEKQKKNWMNPNQRITVYSWIRIPSHRPKSSKLEWITHTHTLICELAAAATFSKYSEE